MAPYSLVFNGTVPIAIEPWEVAGSYFEACNCNAVCPCRRVDGRAGGRSTHGVCQFALSWQITRGVAGTLPLDGLAVVMGGWYHDDEHGSPWRVILYVDDNANHEQHDALRRSSSGAPAAQRSRTSPQQSGPYTPCGRLTSSCRTSLAADTCAPKPI
jgi:Protein of unknown function (DUF1326)